jgi:hypothetical protein
VLQFEDEEENAEDEEDSQINVIVLGATCTWSRRRAGL